MITGTAQVSQVLSASVDRIADPDGLGSATFAYQWLAHDGTSDTPLAGATAATYTVAATDVGKNLKVRVTFTDDGGAVETLHSAATATVPVALTALLQQCAGAPRRHHGVHLPGAVQRGPAGELPGAARPVVRAHRRARDQGAAGQGRQ